VCARGDGDLRRTSTNLTTGGTAVHRGAQGACDILFPCVPLCPLWSCLSMVAIHNTANGATFAVKVHPRAKKNAITGELGDALRLALTAPPVDRKANEACIGFFAKLLKVPRSSVTIAAGLNNRNKVIRVTGLTAQQVRDRLGN
jgi:uncharacterized protein (TIGR00251 family)